MLTPILKNHKRPIYVYHRLGKIIFLPFLFIFCSTRLTAQCFPTGFQNASTFTTDNSIGTYDFSNPSNSQTSNNSRASASALISILSGDTYYLKATGFNFNIPSYASICGVTLEAECRATGLLLTAAVRDNEIRLIKGGVITGSNKSQAGDWGSSDAYRTTGGASDLWGTTLTPADVNASDFGVAISAQIIALVAALPSAQIDHIRLNVHYNPILPVTLAFFNAEKINNKVILEWKTTEEEDNASIILERSLSNNKWDQLSRYDLRLGNTGKSYIYQDILSQQGEYSYRLKMTSASGMVIYSAIKKVHFQGKEILSLYPNPAVDYLYIDNASTGNINIFNTSLQPLRVQAERTGQTSYRLNIRDLPVGLYFVNAGNQTMRFIKK